MPKEMTDTAGAMTGSVPGAARPIAGEWRRLRSSRVRPQAFDPRTVGDLPEPARRWVTHAIEPGVPLSASVGLVMHGTIRLGTWRRFAAEQVLAPPEGYIWAATARVFGLPVVGYDRLGSGTAELRWRLFGLIPVMTAGSAEVTRSAEGRLAAEVVLAPTTFRGATWASGDRPDTAVGTWQIGDDEQRIELHLGRDGNVESLVMRRWGAPPGEPFGCYPFGVTVEAERTFDGITIPSKFRAGWWWGTDRQDEGEFFRAEITAAIASRTSP